MSKTYINVALRQLVIRRANGLCEYCLIHEDDTYFGCQVDHIISEKHGGPTEEGNLAYACSFCNRNKVVILGLSYGGQDNFAVSSIPASTVGQTISP